MNKRAYCTEGKHFPDAVIATVDGCELPLAVYDSYVTWADGTVGVSQEVADLAREDESPVCAEHVNCEVEWREDKRCTACDGTGISVCVDWVDWGMSKAALESKDYCDKCYMANSKHTFGEYGNCPNCGEPVKWNEGRELFETCACGFVDPFAPKEVAK